MNMETPTYELTRMVIRPDGKVERTRMEFDSIHMANLALRERSEDMHFIPAIDWEFTLKMVLCGDTKVLDTKWMTSHYSETRSGVDAPWHI